MTYFFRNVAPETEDTPEESPSADEEPAASSAATTEAAATEGEDDGAAADKEEPTENGEKAEGDVLEKGEEEAEKKE